MYIKQLTIHGFKSYRDQTVFGPFSPETNIIVGRNGSGKSNFFSAIRFVLYDAYTKLGGQEERQALLHEGSGATTSGSLSAYVEITLDNDEGRFPTGRPTTTIKRSVGVKKDEFSVDGRPATKADVINLLQTAGFSRSNPYYIVPQGRITALTNATNEERLSLLKEVAGTRSYEEDRSESLRILEDTSGKRRKISSLLLFIKDRLQELKEEAADLSKYQEGENSRRSLENILAKRELDEVLELLRKHESEAGPILEASSTTSAELDALQSKLASLQSELELATTTLKRSRHNLEAVETELAPLLSTKESIHLSLGMKSTTEDKTALLERLARVEDEILAKEAEMSTIIAENYADQESCSSLEEQLSSCQLQMSKCSDITSRSMQFRNVDERDAWIKEELVSLEEIITSTLSSLQEAKEHKQVAEARLKEEEERKEAHLASLKQQEQQKQQKHQQHHSPSLLFEARKEIWRQERRLQTSQTILAEELKDIKGRMAQSPQAAMMAFRNSLQVMEDLENGSLINISPSEVFGPLFTLFKARDSIFNRAIEQCCSSTSLYMLVLQSSDASSRLLQAVHLKNSTSSPSGGGGGRITMMPLDRSPQDLAERRKRWTALINVRQEEESNGIDGSGVEPVWLIDQLIYAPTVSGAIEHVFGQVLLVPDLDTASSWAKLLDYKVSCITLDGDRVERGGVMSGGSGSGFGGVNTTTNQTAANATAKQLPLLFQCTEVRERIGENKNLLLQLKQRLLEIEAQIGEYSATGATATTVMSDGSQAEQPTSVEPIFNVSSLREEVDERNSLVSKLSRSLSLLQGKRDNFTQEIGTEFGTVSPEKISLLQEEASSLEGRISVLKGKMVEASSLQEELELQLEENLRPQRHEVCLQLSSPSLLSREELEEELRAIEGPITSLKEESSTYQKDIDRWHDSIESELNPSIQSLVVEIERSRQTYLSLLSKLNSSEDGSSGGGGEEEMERYLSKRMLLIERREKIMQGMSNEDNDNDNDAIKAEIESKSTSALRKELHLLRQRLKEGECTINKRALQQMSALQEQEDVLRKRLVELEGGNEAIDGFVDVLDRRKDHCIEETFSAVSKAFSSIWARLVPGSQGMLVMERGDAGDNSNSSSNSDTGIYYKGIDIRLTMPSQAKPMLVRQLSGGQKSLVALALIFAIQKCDPAPFYLFDEIDAALDATYRTAVAELIREMSTEGGVGAAQFILTTFRPELLFHSSSFWGVSFQNRVSRVDEIDEEQALMFVEDEQQQQQEKRSLLSGEASMI